MLLWRINNGAAKIAVVGAKELAKASSAADYPRRVLEGCGG